MSRGTGRPDGMMVAPYLHRVLGMATEELLDGLTAGRREAADTYGVALNWIFDIPGEYGVAAGHVSVDIIERAQPDGLVGLSLAGIEQDVDRSAFADVFARVRAYGLHSVPHAGEPPGRRAFGPPSATSPRSGSDGTSCVRDQRLTDYLGEHRIPIEVCPTSNLRSRAVPELSAHPVTAMLAAGLIVTVNTDDPPMFGADLTGEYLTVAGLADLDEAGVARLSANAVSASFLDPIAKHKLLAEIDEWSAA